MAQYKVGNQILSEEEYKSQVHGNWIFILFGIGVLAAVLIINSLVPSDWPKYLRFSCMFGAAIFCGGILSFFADYVRKFFLISLGTAIAGGIIYWIWLMA